MIDTQAYSQDFLDKDRILNEGGEEVSSDYFYNTNSDAYKCCHAAMKRQFKLPLFWFLLFIILAAGVGALFATSILDFKDNNQGQGHRAEAITVIAFGGVAAGAIIGKIITLRKQNKYYSYEKDNFFESLPEKPNKLMQEFYVLQQCRRCSQYWITLLLVCLSFTTSVYGVIASGIIEAVKKSQQQQQLELSKLFQSGPEKWFGTDTCTTVTHVAWMLIPIWLALYALASYRTNKIINALEKIYPVDEIVDVALCNHRLALLNRKLKIFSFATTALLGCAIFLFTKKYICTLFRRSFYL